MSRIFRELRDSSFQFLSSSSHAPVCIRWLLLPLRLVITSVPTTSSFVHNGHPYTTSHTVLPFRSTLSVHRTVGHFKSGTHPGYGLPLSSTPKFATYSGLPRHQASHLRDVLWLQLSIQLTTTPSVRPVLESVIRSLLSLYGPFGVPLPDLHCQDCLSLFRALRYPAHILSLLPHFPAKLIV